jgi:hypothetical protein
MCGSRAAADEQWALGVEVVVVVEEEVTSLVDRNWIGVIGVGV